MRDATTERARRDGDAVRVLRRLGECVTVQGVAPDGRIVAEFSVVEEDFEEAMVARMAAYIGRRYGRRPHLEVVR